MSGHAAEAHTSAPVDTARLSPEQGKRVMTIGIALAVVGLAGSGAAFAADAHRFAYAWLTGFIFAITISVGALLFVAINHLTRSGWVVASRRHMEWIAGAIPLLALLFIPIALMAPKLYEWMGEAAQHDMIIAGKAAYLNPKFFFGRAIFFLALWSGLSFFYRSLSRKQDESGDPSLTMTLQKWSAPTVLLTGLTLSFAGFDWLMSLDARWYSTIFGVYVFAGATTSSYALLALLTISLQRRGLLQRVSTVEHRHIIGKLLFGFIVFWAYIGFSQFFLIWYANIPEETIFFLHRWEGGWSTWSMLLLFGHFVVPFIILLPRTTKRSYLGLGVGATIMLFMHWVDIYWLVMPNVEGHQFAFSWIDIAGAAGPIGVLCAWVASRLAREPLYPLKDPRLPETVRVDNP